MRLSAIAFALIWTVMPGAAALAQVRQFPYAAVVQSDNVPVRSGRGEQFYATGVLNRGARVTVHRHDPGGWCVIAPPDGSFSWIAADHVRRDGSRGVVTQNHVIVRIGSTLSESHHSVYQTELSTDDAVQILGEKTLSIDGRLKHMYKIAPPAGEYRYVPGQFVAPADRPQPEEDPFAEPLVARQPGAPPPRTHAAQPPDAARDEIIERPVVRTQSRPHGATASEIPATDQEKLRALDDRFRAMIQREPKDWNLTELERGYRDLAAAASHPDMTVQLERRFPAIQKYKAIKTQYDDLMRLTSETSRRDAQLLSIQRQRPATSGEAETETPPAIAPAPRPAAQPQPSQSGAAPAAPPSSPRFDGAGIIQRIATPSRGGPQHVLVAPDGRLLAYLQAARGINLDPYVGREMGLYGERFRHPSLQADYLVVRGLTPVRLAR